MCFIADEAESEQDSEDETDQADAQASGAWHVDLRSAKDTHKTTRFYGKFRLSPPRVDSLLPPTVYNPYDFTTPSSRPPTRSDMHARLQAHHAAVGGVPDAERASRRSGVRGGAVGLPVFDRRRFPSAYHLAMDQVRAPSLRTMEPRKQATPAKASTVALYASRRPHTCLTSPSRAPTENPSVRPAAQHTHSLTYPSHALTHPSHSLIPLTHPSHISHTPHTSLTHPSHIPHTSLTHPSRIPHASLTPLTFETLLHHPPPKLDRRKADPPFSGGGHAPRNRHTGGASQQQRLNHNSDAARTFAPYRRSSTSHTVGRLRRQSPRSSGSSGHRVL